MFFVSLLVFFSCVFLFLFFVVFVCLLFSLFLVFRVLGSSFLCCLCSCWRSSSYICFSCFSPSPSPSSFYVSASSPPPSSPSWFSFFLHLLVIAVCWILRWTPMVGCWNKRYPHHANRPSIFWSAAKGRFIGCSWRFIGYQWDLTYHIYTYLWGLFAKERSCI